METAPMVDSAAAHGTARKLDRASWGALFAGFFVGIGMLFLLLSLGAAIGLSSVDPRNMASWKNMGLGVGIWGGISAIIASFVSAWITARLSTAMDRTGGILHGVALWGLTWAAGLVLGFMAVSGVVAGAAQVAGSAAQAGAQAASGASPQERKDAANALPSGKQLQAQAQGKLDEMKQNAPEAAAAAASGGQKGAWGAFLATLFTLLASACGGGMGIPDRARATPARAGLPDARVIPQRA
jgi:hypothetical protein